MDDFPIKVEVNDDFEYSAAVPTYCDVDSDEIGERQHKLMPDERMMGFSIKPESNQTNDNVEDTQGQEPNQEAVADNGSQHKGQYSILTKYLTDSRDDDPLRESSPNGQPIWSCRKCDYSCYLADSFVQHIAMVHPNQANYSNDVSSNSLPSHQRNRMIANIISESGSPGMTPPPTSNLGPALGPLGQALAQPPLVQIAQGPSQLSALLSSRSPTGNQDYNNTASGYLQSIVHKVLHKKSAEITTGYAPPPPPLHPSRYSQQSQSLPPESEFGSPGQGFGTFSSNASAVNVVQPSVVPVSSNTRKRRKKADNDKNVCPCKEGKQFVSKNVQTETNSKTVVASVQQMAGTYVYECQDCGISFNDMVLHSLHMGCHSHSNVFTCNMCGTTCNDKYGFNTHLLRGHDSKQKL